MADVWRSRRLGEIPTTCFVAGVPTATAAVLCWGSWEIVFFHKVFVAMSRILAMQMGCFGATDGHIAAIVQGCSRGRTCQRTWKTSWWGVSDFLQPLPQKSANVAWRKTGNRLLTEIMFRLSHYSCLFLGRTTMFRKKGQLLQQGNTQMTQMTINPSLSKKLGMYTFLGTKMSQGVWFLERWCSLFNRLC